MDGVYWLALGDSYSSGEGSTYTKTKCAQALNYAYAGVAHRQVGSHLGGGRAELDFEACTGARAIEHALDTEEYPRHIPQQLALADHPRYDLITLTIGGNDLDFGGIMSDCFTRGVTWRGCDINWSALDGDIDRLRDQLVEVYSTVADDRLSEGGHLVVLGYPRIYRDPEVWTNRKCNGVGVDDAHRLNRAGDRLAETIESAVGEARRTHSNMHFVDVRGLFELHGLCSTQSEWINKFGLKWYSRGASLFPPVRYQGSFHPNDAGYAAEGELLAEKLLELDWSGLDAGALLVLEQDRLAVRGGRSELRLEVGRRIWALNISELMLFQAMTSLLTGETVATWSNARVAQSCGRTSSEVWYWGPPDRPYLATEFSGNVLVGYRAASPHNAVEMGDGVPIGVTREVLQDHYIAKARVVDEGPSDTGLDLFRIDGEADGPELGASTRDGIVVQRGSGDNCAIDAMALEASRGSVDEEVGGAEEGGAPWVTYPWRLRIWTLRAPDDVCEAAGPVCEAVGVFPWWTGATYLLEDGSIEGDMQLNLGINLLCEGLTGPGALKFHELPVTISGRLDGDFESGTAHLRLEFGQGAFEGYCQHGLIDNETYPGPAMRAYVEQWAASMEPIEVSVPVENGVVLLDEPVDIEVGGLPFQLR